MVSEVFLFVLTEMFIMNCDCVCFIDSEADKKSAVDQAFRDVLLHLVVSCLLSWCTAATSVILLVLGMLVCM